MLTETGIKDKCGWCEAALSALLKRLQAAAEAYARDEEAFRRDSERQLQTLTARRVAAYRRCHLHQTMVAAAGGTDGPEEARAAILDAALAETGWNEDDAAYDEVVGQLAAVAVAVLTACAAEGTADEDYEARAAVAAMLHFEAWYRGRFGSEFLDLFELERGFLPVVDF
jgi:hypothetical protein